MQALQMTNARHFKALLINFNSFKNKPGLLSSHPSASDEFGFRFSFLLLKTNKCIETGHVNQQA